MIISNRSDCQRVSAYRIVQQIATEIMVPMDGCFGTGKHTFPRDHFHKTSNKEPRNMLIQLKKQVRPSKSRVFFCHTYIIYPTKFHVQEEFTSASQINQFLVAKPPETLPVCAPVFPAQPERPRTEFGGNETSCYQSPKQPKMTCVSSANLIFIVLIYIYIVIH